MCFFSFLCPLFLFNLLFYLCIKLTSKQERHFVAFNKNGARLVGLVCGTTAHVRDNLERTNEQLIH